ncbi:MAG: hypothetical protein IJ644_05550 [Oscillospiraceae bacterium]|nr:hypothetical protein [Oscillospiraceae bacterium]
MKKTRIFAGLTALLLCFQAGISMTAFAEETETSVQTDFFTDLEQTLRQVENFIVENNLYHLSCTDVYDYAIWIHLDEGSDEANEQYNQLMQYCKEMGFTEKYTFPTETSLLSDNQEETDLTESGLGISVLAGDVTLDETLDILDVVTLNRAILGKENLNALQNIAADANKDGSIDSFDSLAIMKAIVGLIEKASDKQLSPNVKYLSKAVKSDTVEGKSADDAFITAQTRFYLNIFQNAEQETPDKNILVSPYSVMQALAMTANGADGQTRSEMEQALGGIPLEELNQYLYTQRTNQPNTEKCKVSTANSIWYRDWFGNSIKPDFLKVNADYYSADAFSAPFDESTAKDINSWVSNKTDRMITQLLNPEMPISANTMLYLINAVTFDAKWAQPYTGEYSVFEKDFTAWDGSVQKVSMMSSEECYYLEDEQATGFYKSYSGGRYAFAALLPNEDVSVDAYISGLTADSLQETLSHPTEIVTYAKLPKFSYDYDITLNEALMSMGMNEAFDSQSADFSRMAEISDINGNLSIGSVVHKTHIEVAEEGTRAAAVTAVELCGNALIEDYRTVTLDRPFVYMIVDMDTHLPVFMGAVKSIQ